VACRSRRVGSGFGRSSSLRGRPRLRGGGAPSRTAANRSSCLRLLPGRLLARLDLGSVARDRSRDAPTERALDQRRVHLGGRITLRELREGAGKRGFRGHLRASLPTEDATQRLVEVEALDQRGGGGNAQHRLGDEGPGEGAAILGRPAGASGRFGNEGFEADHIKRRHEAPERLSQRVDFLVEPRKQGALDMAPAGFHGVERIVGHACCCESGTQIETIPKLSMSESRIFSRNRLENHRVDSRYVASFFISVQIILQLPLDL